MIKEPTRSVNLFEVSYGVENTQFKFMVDMVVNLSYSYPSFEVQERYDYDIFQRRYGLKLT